MTRLIKKVAAMAAAIMMMGTMTIGASASGIIIDRDPAPYASKYMRMACEASLNLKNKNYDVYNLTCCLRNGYKEMGARCSIENASGKILKQTDPKPKRNPKVGNIRTPHLDNQKSYPHKKAVFYSYMLTSSNAPKKKTLYIDFDERTK